MSTSFQYKLDLFIAANRMKRNETFDAGEEGNQSSATNLTYLNED